MIELEIKDEFLVKVDDDMFDELSMYRWFLYRGEPVRAIYIPERKNSVYRGMSKDVLGIPSSERVKYLDRDKLNQQSDNLQLTTHQQQIMAQRRSKNNTTGYKGVHYRSELERFEAYVHWEGKKVNLGYFQNVLDAAEAYNNMASKLFGEDAKLNEVW